MKERARVSLAREHLRKIDNHLNATIWKINSIKSLPKEKRFVPYRELLERIVQLVEYHNTKAIEHLNLFFGENQENKDFVNGDEL